LSKSLVAETLGMTSYFPGSRLTSADIDRSGHLD
jgi:hypothetical protein